MSNLIKEDELYRRWISEISKRFKNFQIKASVNVNREMLLFYWALGKDIDRLKAESRWGSGFIRTLSEDLQKELPDVKGFSRTNLFYIINFYKLYKDLDFVPQPEGQINTAIFPRAEGQSDNESIQIQNTKTDISLIFNIPWGHHKLIIDRCGKDLSKALFFVAETLKNGWSRALLLNFLDTDLYERSGKAITNFPYTLPPTTSELAQEITRDPYNFDFLTLTKPCYEKELKDALMDNLTRFLLELGTGFAFVGKEYRIKIGNTEQFIDMLFYNITLHCYVVIEVKITAFEPEHMGQIGTYVSAVNEILRKEGDAQTIGLLICKTKDNVLAQYAVNSLSEPVGISEYQLNNLIPDDFKGTIPSVEEIEQELSDFNFD